VIAGQGTIGLEIARHAPWCDSVAVSVGGGGLAAGLSVSLGPDRPVVAVEPEHCNSLHAAFSAGGPVDAPVDSAAASALGASRIGENAFALLSSGKVQLALVTEREIAHARDLLWEELRLPSSRPPPCRSPHGWTAGFRVAIPAWSFAARTPTGIRRSRTVTTVALGRIRLRRTGLSVPVMMSLRPTRSFALPSAAR